jgi:hypothetical protein
MQPVNSAQPIPNAYWVLPGRLMAGEYPHALQEGSARLRFRWLLDAGINFFLDLTQPGEYGLRPYESLLLDEASVSGIPVVHRRMPIEDMGTPAPDEMRAILDILDEAMDKGRRVYVHCYGGLGRTGTVVGCYLAQQGMGGEAALRELNRLRQATSAALRRSPETTAQRRMVLDWNEP